MIARKAEAQKLLIGHISNRNDELEALVEEAQVVFENTLAAKEGMKISIPLTK